MTKTPHSFAALALLLFASAFTNAQEAPAIPPVPAVPPVPPRARAMERDSVRHISRSSNRSDGSYSAGKSQLDRSEYDKAVDSFNRTIEEKSPRADGALYWRAYAENKLGKRTESLATLAELQKSYPNSRWLDDAKALQVEVRQASGRPVTPESASDEELKLLALSSLANSDPERTIPMLEKLLKSGNSPRLKERALFVVAQGHSQKGRDLIAQVARGNYNPDLQIKAVEYLGVFGGKENQQALADIYKSTTDMAIKRRILNSFLVCDCQDSLLSVAKTEANPELRLEAIRLLGAMGRSKSGEALVALYAKESDLQLRREILNSLFAQGNAPAIIDVAKKETDPTLKREAVQRLSHMRSKEATDYLMELLNK